MHIAPLAAADVRRLTGAQVVLDLRAVVKELIENALDAHATAIEVRFRGHGTEAIEVVDNGAGIAPADYGALALRHHTSKLASLGDLTAVSTFGFRGEALAAMCAVATLAITTATREQAPVGTVLEFERSGALRSSDRKVARPHGTTATVSELFAQLPVRRRELEKHAKREYAKAHALIQAYALISRGVRWETSLFNNGRRQSQLVVQASSGDDHIMANVTALFGARAAGTLMPLALTIDRGITVRIVGAISRPSFGSGRSTGDRQYLYINGRPWDAPRFARIFNDVYRQYNATQVPFVVADFSLPLDAYDVNVTPDKRTVYVHHETALLEGLRDTLDSFYAPTRGVFEMHGPPVHGVQRAAQPATEPAASPEPPADHEPNPSPEPGLAARPTRQYTPHASTISTSTASWSQETSPRDNHSTLQTQFRQAVERFSMSQESRDTTELEYAESEPTTPGEQAALDHDAQELREQHEESVEPVEPVEPVAPVESAEPAGHVDQVEPADVVEPVAPAESPSEPDSPHTNSPRTDFPPASSSPSPPRSPLWPRGPTPEARKRQRIAATASPDEGPEVVQTQTAPLGTLPIDVSALASSSQPPITPAPPADDSLADAGIDSADAEATLERVIEKGDFAHMEVVGQFNRGFIIARRRVRGMDDLFIIDQHAADEKYNFEMLQQNTQLQTQQLIRPQTVELAPADELVAQEHIAQLRASGFVVWVDASAPPGRRLQLHALPASRDVVYSVSDLEELLVALRDAPRAQRVHCAKTRALFASRACRKSIMIGSALELSRMRTVVRHMGEIEQPWNCPHGRPTMRHLTAVPARARARTVNWAAIAK